MVDDTEHRELGSTLFNHTWELLETDPRTEDEDLELLLAAAASRWHWQHVGTVRHRATGDWQVARALSALGAGDLALRFAARALRSCELEGAGGWQLASAHEGVARAHQVRADLAARDVHVTAARAALAEEEDADDRAAIEAQLADLTDHD